MDGLRQAAGGHACAHGQGDLVDHLAGVRYNDGCVHDLSPTRALGQLPGCREQLNAQG